ncbi:MAG: hydrogenase maturation protease [Fibrobacterota bacterium]
MNRDFEKGLMALCAGKTAFLGIGNPDRGDDGAGMALAHRLESNGVAPVFYGNTFPEQKVPVLRDNGFENVIFLDAVDAGIEPGAAVLLDAAALQQRYPQISTHTLSLGTLARLISDNNACQVWLLGIQSASIALGPQSLSPRVGQTVQRLAELITGQCPVPQESACH